ncbi:MAG: DUF4340 domain-containing protein [Planctomycetia bacterium]|nr:MAG: DUF4340 domain-containing protein [Planctomycetia bacterium]
MNFKTTLMLLVLLVIAGSVYWLFPADPAGRSAPPATADESSRLTPVFEPMPEEKDIRQVTFATAGRPEIVFERGPAPSGRPGQPDEWRIVSPVQAPAETWVVSGMVNSFARLQSHIRYGTNGSSAVSDADAGFDRPRATLRFTLADGKTLTLEIGRQREIPSGTYVRAGGAAVAHLIERDFSTELKRELKDFRAKTLTRFSANDARRLNIEVDGKRFALSKTDDGEWLLTEPIRARADARKVSELLTKLAAARAEEFIAEDALEAGASGMDAPSLRVTLETRSPVPPAQPATQPAEGPEPEPSYVTTVLSLDVGGFADLKQTNRYVRVATQPGLARVPTTALDALRVKLNDLVDPKITGLSRDRISRIELAGAVPSAAIERRDGAWHGAGDLAELDTEAVATLITAIEELRSVSIVDDPAAIGDAGFNPPRATVTVTSDAALAPLIIQVGATTASGVNAYLRIDGQPLTYVVDAREANKLAAGTLALRSRVIVDARPEQLTRIERRRGDTVHVLARHNAAWELVEPAGAALDSNAAQELANDLARLRAKRAVARGAGEGLGLDAPDAVISFTVLPAPTAAAAAAPSAAGTTIAAAPTDATDIPEGGPADGGGATDAGMGDLPGPGEASAPEAGAPDGANPAVAPAASAPVEYTLHVASRAGAWYAKLADGAYAYELDESVGRVLTGELLRRELFAIGTDSIRGVRVRSPAGVLEFAREGEEWKFAADPFVKLSQERVNVFVMEIARMRADTLIAWRGGTAPSDAPLRLTLLLDGAREVHLDVTADNSAGGTRIGFLPADGRLFTIRDADVENLERPLTYYLQQDGPPARREGVPPPPTFPMPPR